MPRDHDSEDGVWALAWCRKDILHRSYGVDFGGVSRGIPTLNINHIFSI